MRDANDGQNGGSDPAGDSRNARLGWTVWGGKAALAALVFAIAAISASAPVLDAVEVAVTGEGKNPGGVTPGTDGDDDIIGRLGAGDVVDAGRGNDSVWGRGGADVVRLGEGRDYVSAGSGSDVIYARDGERDVVYCGNDMDRVQADEYDETHECEDLNPNDE